jgi:hypothetical protein
MVGCGAQLRFDTGRKPWQTSPGCIHPTHLKIV